jgi:hypothetical protein
MLGAIDQWRGAREDKPTRAEAIRRLVELGLGVSHPPGALEDASARMAELTKLFQKPDTSVTGPGKVQTPVSATAPDPTELLATARTAKLQREEKATSIRMKHLRR